MAEPAGRSRPSRWSSRATLLVVVLAALGLRLLAAGAVQLYTQQRHSPFVFGDTAIYWHLAEQIRTGRPYVVEQWGVPHSALRTPGYPIFLAACQAAFGPENTMAARAAQAVLGTLGVLGVYGLVGTVVGSGPAIRRRRAKAAAMVAAALAAVEPYTIGLSALLLSEAAFVPLMVWSLWGLARLWKPRATGAAEPLEPRPRPIREGLIALGTGLGIGAALMVRPSWLVFVAGALVVWVLSERRARVVRLAAIVVLAASAVMAPWWIRNAQIFGKFVPTAVWIGASLYDGLSPEATGASDMGFLGEEPFVSLGELEQDAELRRRALAFVKDDPERALELAAIKAGRFWSPWPNADTLNAPGIAAFSAATTIPIFFLLLFGIWICRKDIRTLTLLGGSLLAFFLLHLIFVGSIRYRLPGMVPAMGLAALGLIRLLGGRPDRAGRDVRRIVAWSILTPLSVLIGGGWYAARHATESAELAAFCESEMTRLLPGSRIAVARVKLRPLTGSITVDQIKVDQGLPTMKGPTVEVGWLRIVHEVWSMLGGTFQPREIIVAQPTLRIGRRPDGRWNLEGFLADPWPLPVPEEFPRILIHNGTLILSDEDDSSAVLREVEATFTPASSRAYQFEGTALGDGFERLRIAGVLDLKAGRIDLASAELTRLELGTSLRERLPEDWRAAYDELGVTGGALDLLVERLSLDLDRLASEGLAALRHELTLHLRSGTWASSRLPFQLNDVELDGRIADGRLTIERAQGVNGRTTARAEGTVDLLDLAAGPMDLRIDLTDLEFDERLRAKLPPGAAAAWDDFRPSGRFHAYAHILRENRGEEAAFGLTIDCRDVSLNYVGCPYPLDHIRGRIDWVNDRLTIPEPGLRTIIGNRPARCWGTIDQPGDEAVVRLHFEMGALPMDETLMNALHTDVRDVIREFHPRGTLRVAEAEFVRKPPPEPGAEEIIELTAALDLGEPDEAGGFSFTWEGLPYPVHNVKGRLIIRPEGWTFEDLVGWNGRTRIEGSGWVAQRGPELFDLDVILEARDLRFEPMLKDALPPEWQASWEVLDPRGTASMEARVQALDGAEHTEMTVVPGNDAAVRLSFTPTASEPGEPRPEPLDLPAFEAISGTFVYNDGLVTMKDVGFGFRGSPVRFRQGTVRVEDTGAFALSIDGLMVERFRLDAELRSLMPPLMADFARRLDESPPLPLMGGNLRLGWSGQPGEPAFVAWEDGLVVFNGQTIRAGTPLESIQGRLDEFDGRFDGRALRLAGLIDVDSFVLARQQVTNVRAPLAIEDNQAHITIQEGSLLGGTLAGEAAVTLDEESEFDARLELADADLARYTATMPGRQRLGGRLSGHLALNGLANQPRSIRGVGAFEIDQGDLGELPAALRFVKALNTLDINAPDARTAFDSARVSVIVEDGRAYLNPIRLSGDAISLFGSGTMDFRGELDLRLRLLYGRNGLRIPLLSPAFREAGGQFVDIRVTGPAAAPSVQPVVLPGAIGVLRSLGDGMVRPAGRDRQRLR